MTVVTCLPVLSRRHWMGMAALAMNVTVGWAASPTLPSSDSLEQDLRRALRAKQPLVVMVSLDGCPYCHAARRSFLVPMSRQGHLAVVQLDMRSNRAVRDFAGQMRTQDELIQQWGVKVAPTLLFFGPQGVEIAERMVGGYLPDFYGAYLDERLQKAQRIVREFHDQ